MDEGIKKFLKDFLIHKYNYADVEILDYYNSPLSNRANTQTVKYNYKNVKKAERWLVTTAVITDIELMAFSYHVITELRMGMRKPV